MIGIDRLGTFLPFSIQLFNNVDMAILVGSEALSLWRVHLLWTRQWREFWSFLSWTRLADLVAISDETLGMVIVQL